MNPVSSGVAVGLGCEKAGLPTEEELSAADDALLALREGPWHGMALAEELRSHRSPPSTQYGGIGRAPASSN